MPSQSLRFLPGRKPIKISPAKPRTDEKDPMFVGISIDRGNGSLLSPFMRCLITNSIFAVPGRFPGNSVIKASNQLELNTEAFQIIGGAITKNAAIKGINIDEKK